MEAAEVTQLYIDMHRAVAAWFRRRGHEELEGAVWVAVWRQREQCRGTAPEQRYAWVWCIARRTYAGHYAKHVRREALVVEHARPVTAPDAFAAIDARVDCAALRMQVACAAYRDALAAMARGDTVPKLVAYRARAAARRVALTRGSAKSEGDSHAQIPN